MRHDDQFDKVLKDFFRVPAITAYNRLEGRPRTVDFTRSLRAEVRDALWFLTRQWQLGELAGGGRRFADRRAARDAARLVRPRLVRRRGGRALRRDDAARGRRRARGVPVDAAGADRGGRDLPSQGPGRRPRAASRRQRARGSRCDLDPDWAREPDALALHRIAARRAFDGAKMLASHAAGTLAADLGAAAADVDPAADAVAAWRRARVRRRASRRRPRAWIPDRLAYDVRISTAATANGEQALLSAPRYAGRTARLVRVRRGSCRRDARPGRMARRRRRPEPAIKPLSFVPTAASFPGMPNPRFWEMEDRRINFGSLNAKTTDHLLLIFAEMGLIYGNDWFVVPFEMPVNHLCEVLGLVVTDVFGDRTLVPPANGAAENVWQRWSFFSVTGESRDDWRGRFFWLPASLTSVDESEPLEAVSFARDEMANLAWARRGRRLRRHRQGHRDAGC